MHDGRQLQFERLLFFSDAVFAIAITLLVIELKVPAGEYATDQDLANGLLTLVPNYIGFLISFLVIGRFWAGHHHQLAVLADFDETLIWRNLLFLGAIAFLPFPNAVVSHFGSSQTAVLFYTFCLIGTGLLNRRLFAHVITLAKAKGADISTLRSGWQPVVIGVAASLVTLLHPLAGLGTLMLTPLYRPAANLAHRLINRKKA